MIDDPRFATIVSTTAALCVVALGYLVLINAIATGCTIATGAADQPATEPSPAEDISAQLTARLTRLDARLSVVEGPLFAPRPAKRTRRRPAKKPISRQPLIVPEIAVLPTEDLLCTSCA